MKYLFFFVSGSDAYKDALGFHSNYFETHNGFLYGLILALVIALIMAVVFYFIICKKYALATKRTWWILSILVAVISYFATDILLIGGQGSTAERPYTFYGCNELLVIEKKSKPNAKQYRKLKMKIESELQKYKDVRFPFDITCAGWGWLFFLGASIPLKRFSVNGTQIPV